MTGSFNNKLLFAIVTIMKRNLLFTVLICATVYLPALAQHKNETPDPANLVITPEHPLRVEDSAMRDAVVKWSLKQLNNKNYKQIKAQPSSSYFPGKVKEGYSLISKTIEIDHKKIRDSLVPIVSRLRYSDPWSKIMYSTGLYAVPGQYIEVIIPKELVGKGLGVQIGCHSDELNQWMAAKEDWRRMPIIVKSQALKKEKTGLASPFGGLIYITISPKTPDLKVSVTIDHAITAPLYTLGKTTQQEWETQLKNNKAPWGELASDDIILTVPDSVLQTVSDPEKVMKLWDLIIGGEMDLAQIPKPFYRAQRLVIDEHIGGGFMHSGYPIMVHHSPVMHMYSEDIIANPLLLMQPSKGGANWGFFHEIGHNMQNIDWVFGGTTEVSCNFFSIYMFDRLMGGRDEAHPGISNKYTQQAMKTYFDAGANYEKWKDDPFLGLIMFRQLQEGFGWEAFKHFFRIYQALAAQDPEDKREQSDEEKRDLWVKTFSDVTGRDIAPFFEKWGIPISSGVKESLTKYPVWMPYNFPPVN